MECTGFVCNTYMDYEFKFINLELINVCNKNCAYDDSAGIWDKFLFFI